MLRLPPGRGGTDTGQGSGQDARVNHMNHQSLDEYYRVWQLEREVELLRKRKKEDPLSPLARPPPVEPAKPGEDGWDALLAGKLPELVRSIEQLKEEIEVRTGLRDYSVGEIDHQIFYLQSSLTEFSHWGLGYNTGVDVKRNWLEKQLGELRKERRRLEHQCFNDLVQLRRELREVVAEYRQLARRQRLLRGGEADGD
jgi:hypothetical protein